MSPGPVQWMLRGTLKRQLIVSVAAVHAVLMMLFIADLTLRQRRLLLESQVEHATALSRSLATSSGGWIAARDVSGLQEIIQAQTHYPDLEFGMILGEDGRVLAHTDPARLGLYVSDLPNPPQAAVLSRSRELVDVAVPVAIGSVHVGWARVGINQRTATARLDRMALEGAAYAAVAILVGSALAWLLADRITRRLHAVETTMDQVHAGNIAARTQVEGHDEAASLSKEFNRMLDALEERASQRDTAERELRESTHFLDAIIHNLPLMVFVKEAKDLRFVALNRAGEQLLGYPADQLLGKQDADLFPEPQASNFVAADREVLEGGSLKDIQEELIQTRSGEQRILHTLKVPILDEEGRPRFLLGISQDITEQKRLQEERRRMEGELHRIQRMESLGSLASGVAHDMNNVIGAILALADIQREKAEPGSRLQRDMETIAKACLRARTLVRGLLGFARQDLAEASHVDLNALVREEIALLERTTLGKVKLVPDLEEPLHPVLGDPAALSHALMNLCVNAVDAMPQGGTLTISTRNAEDGRVQLDVTDTGEGMPPDVLERAQDPFFTTKPPGKGTGLGLSIVYGTMKAHHGTMEIRSAPGAGTQVRLRLPALSEPADLPVDPESAPTAGRQARILVVDDDELIHAALDPLLESLGHDSVSARSGEEALRLLEVERDIGLVILDLNMPGLGGEGTLPLLRALRPDLSILLATGRADQHAMELCRLYPGVTLLPKPFTREEIQAQIQRLL